MSLWRNLIDRVGHITVTGGGGGSSGGDAGLPYAYSWRRANFGLPNWYLRTPYAGFGYELWVDFEQGDDSNPGTLTNPFKTLNSALSKWKNDGKASNAVIWLRARQHREYFSHHTDGFSTAVSTETNTSGFMDGLGGAPGAELHIRTWYMDVLDGQMCVFDGTGIEAYNYATSFSGLSDKPWRTRYGYPNMIGWNDAHDLRIMDIEFAGSAGRTLAFESSDNVHIINCHVHHGYGDGLGILYGTNIRIEDCLTHHHIDVINGGNSSSGFKMPEGSDNLYVRIITFKNTDDGLDMKDSASDKTGVDGNYRSMNGCYVIDCVTWGNGWFWMEEPIGDWKGKEFLTTGSSGPGQVSADGHPFDGNGNGIKPGGAPTGNGNAHTIVAGNIAFNNRLYNITQNGGEGYFFYNNTTYNGVLGGWKPKADNVSWYANNASYEPTAIEGIMKAEGPPWSYWSRNTWANNEDGSPNGVDNFNLSLSASSFKSLNPSSTDFLVPTNGGLIRASAGFSTPTQMQSLSGWGVVTMGPTSSRPYAPTIDSNIGAR